MITRTVIERVGELLGPVDWNYNFLQHFDCYCGRDKQEYCDKHVERLRLVSESPEKYEATTYGGWPRCGWGKILAVGMYDGWPYWRPVPSMLIASWMGGGQWSGFSHITNLRVIETGEII